MLHYFHIYYTIDHWSYLVKYAHYKRYNVRHFLQKYFSLFDTKKHAYTTLFQTFSTLCSTKILCSSLIIDWLQTCRDVLWILLLEMDYCVILSFPYQLQRSTFMLYTFVITVSFFQLREVFKCLYPTPDRRILVPDHFKNYEQSLSCFLEELIRSPVHNQLTKMAIQSKVSNSWSFPLNKFCLLSATCSKTYPVSSWKL